MKVCLSFLLLLVVSLVTQAEISTMAVTVEPPTKYIDGTPIESGGIVGYRYYTSLDEPFTNLTDFAGEVTEVLVVEENGEIVEDATELVLTFDFDDSPTIHKLYTTVVVIGARGLDSVPFIPVKPLGWEVARVPSPPGPVRSLRFVPGECRAKLPHFICNWILYAVSSRGDS